MNKGRSCGVRPFLYPEAALVAKKSVKERGTVLDWCRRATNTVWVKGCALARAIWKEVGVILIGLAGLLLVALVARLVLPLLPPEQQATAIIYLKDKGVPDGFLPKVSSSFSKTIGIGPGGFGFANALFADAERETTLEFDRAQMKRIVVCHHWTGDAESHTAVLRRFLSEHPGCFRTDDRPGGGIKVRALIGPQATGDLITSADGSSILAFACDCRSNLMAIKAEVTR